MDFLRKKKRGSLFVVSAPAGTGKSTLVSMLLKEFPQLRESISSTTRAPREGEVNGQHYQFVSIEEFEQKIQNNEFVEYADVFGNYYGTSVEMIYQLQDEGFHVVFVIDTQGALQLRQRFPEATLIFIRPPSMEELRRRLLERRTEKLEVIETRLQWAKRELEAAHHYDYILENNVLDEAYQVLRAILIADIHRQSPLQRPQVSSH